MLGQKTSVSPLKHVSQSYFFKSHEVQFKGLHLLLASAILTVEKVHCASLCSKETGSCSYANASPPTARGPASVSLVHTTGMGQVVACRAQTRSVATRGSSTGKKVGLKEAGCQGWGASMGMCSQSYVSGEGRGEGVRADSEPGSAGQIAGLRCGLTCRLFFGRGTGVLYGNPPKW